MNHIVQHFYTQSQCVCKITIRINVNTNLDQLGDTLKLNVFRNGKMD